MIKIGVVGYGYWGPNVVRNFCAIPKVNVASVCDIDNKCLARVQQTYPHIKTCRDYNAIVTSPAIDAVAIVTPVSTHYEIAKKAIENGKHIFVEKPFTQTVKQAETLIRLARKRKVLIMVDHTFIFTGAVRKIKQIIDAGKLGNLYYYDSTRVSLGNFQPDVNVIWDLAPHDFSIIDLVIKQRPVAVTAYGADHLKRGAANLAYITLHFNSSFLAHINVNWLSPVKVRTTLIGGQKKILLWDDLQVDERIKVYDKGVKNKTKEGMYKMMVNYRAGDMFSPRVDTTEALTVELKYFIECIRKNKKPVNSGEAGLRVVKLLAATDISLRAHGEMVKL